LAEGRKLQAIVRRDRNRINQRARNGPTISFDEFGPLEIRPQGGQSYCIAIVTRRCRGKWMVITERGPGILPETSPNEEELLEAGCFTPKPVDKWAGHETINT
jgi:hypothetical protein